MKNSDLKNLRKRMDQSIYKKNRFTAREIDELFEKTRKYDKKNSYFPQTLSVVVTIAFFLFVGMYVYENMMYEASSFKLSSSSKYEETSSRSLIEELNNNDWKNIHYGELKQADFVGLALVEENDILKKYSTSTRVIKKKGDDTFIAHKVKSRVDSSEHIILEQWNFKHGLPRWLEEEIVNPDTKKIVKSDDMTIYLRAEKDTNIGFIVVGEFIFFVLGNEKTITFTEIEEIIDYIVHSINFSNFIIYEQKRSAQ